MGIIQFRWMVYREFRNNSIGEKQFWTLVKLSGTWEKV
jgi:hypothetical protein